jgi:oligopeptide/dipeptide ABC transporter ATP-binding protein
MHGLAASGALEVDPVTDQEVRERAVGPASEPRPLLDVRDLRVEFHTIEGVGRAVNGVDLSVNEQQILGIVGESGSGKSVIGSALVNLVRSPGRIVSGSVSYQGRDLLREPERALQQIRGREIGLIVQNAKSALNPLIPIGHQLINVLRAHRTREEGIGVDRAVAMLTRVGIPDPAVRLHAYPHQLSGGMAQRVMIAMALSNNPRLLVADEPTSGLDVTIQAQILDLIQALVQEMRSATILITRDLGIVAQYCQAVAVLYAGRIVERAPVRAFFRSPTHPYSEALIKSVAVTRQRGRKLLSGASPSIYELPAGCPLHPRCDLVQPICREVMPGLQEISPGHWVRCHVRAAESG